MTVETPQPVEKARLMASTTIESFRGKLFQMFAIPEDRKRLDGKAVRDLYQQACLTPHAAHLAELLARMIPGEVFKFQEPKEAGTDAAKAQDRLIKLSAAIIEAGLAEQQDANGKLHGAENMFSAQALEKSLDDWLVHGKYRGAAFEAAPLTKIDDMISFSGGAPISPVEAIETRFGLLIPVVANIHLWRLLEEMPASESAKLGWSTAVSNECSDAAPI